MKDKIIVVVIIICQHNSQLSSVVVINYLQDYRDILGKLEFDGPHGSPFIIDHE